MNYALHILVYIEFYAIAALGLNVVAGYCGVLSLCHASFVALGGYAYALLTLVAGFSFGPALAAALVVGIVGSLAVSLPAQRLSGDFLVLGTLAVQSLVFSLLYNWSHVAAPIGSWSNLTNGPFGLSGIPRPVIADHVFSSLVEFAGLTTLIAGLCFLLARRLHASPWKRALTALRDDEVAARGLGKRALRFRIEAHAFACGMAAIAGALYAAYANYLDPSIARLDESILLLTMVLIGGTGNVAGPLVGAALIVLLPEFLRLMNLPETMAANLRLACFGLLLIWVVHVRPRGLCGDSRVH